ncbi:MAG: ElyC/SanA/YdcF family protein [Acidobacteriota bacterium]
MSVLTPLVGNLYLWLWLAAAATTWLLTRGSQRRRWAIVGLVAFWLLGCRPIGDLALRLLENRHAQPPVNELRAQGLNQVVVLTAGGYEPLGDLASSALTSGSAARFLGGLELCARLAPNCRLILSGSAGRGNRQLAAAEHMQRLADQLGTSLEVVAEARSGSTAEHPAGVRPLLEDRPFALVTSAYHMPRALRSFQKAGMTPVAFPVDRHTRGVYRLGDWIPSFGALGRMQLAWRETLALVLYTVRGW